ncbi:aldo/keto reductase [Deinococcus sp. HMF7620]|uniref:Aldo/keto reductase n=1 Tax=Deinococcus arboris TaxID=2682977 RepID=A0A7C9M0B5_9DEIO|nr:aldo/keto reductase [Deinococcus arboris]MVN85942.1 aldo/keto reductase [Deinococcus arboris]
MNLSSYRTLGRSGLVVSPLALGTMTFGTARWGASDDESQAIFNAYVEAGGNFIDTADVYAGGRSEEWVGRFVAQGKLRERLVLATKAAFSTEKGNPHASGNGRKHLHAALDASLRRLNTDYIDLYWLHIWDMVTPAEEVLQTLGNFVREGRIQYFGFSNVPAWYAAKAATLAQVHGVPGPIALQLEYSLVGRDLEREHAPAARELGLGLTPWSPLAAGFLTGKYTREDGLKGTAQGEGRLNGPNPFGDSKFTERNWRTLDALKAVAAEVDRPLAQVALAWVVAQPGVTSTIIGASSAQQLTDNLASLDVRLSAEQLKTLSQASAPDTLNFFSDGLRSMIFGGSDVQG